MLAFFGAVSGMLIDIATAAAVAHLRWMAGDDQPEGCRARVLERAVLGDAARRLAETDALDAPLPRAATPRRQLFRLNLQFNPTEIRSGSAVWPRMGAA